MASGRIPGTVCRGMRGLIAPSDKQKCLCWYRDLLSIALHLIPLSKSQHQRTVESLFWKMLSCYAPTSFINPPLTLPLPPSPALGVQPNHPRKYWQTSLQSATHIKDKLWQQQHLQFTDHELPPQKHTGRTAKLTTKFWQVAEQKV